MDAGNPGASSTLAFVATPVGLLAFTVPLTFCGAERDCGAVISPAMADAATTAAEREEITDKNH